MLRLRCIDAFLGVGMSRAKHAKYCASLHTQPPVTHLHAQLRFMFAIPTTEFSFLNPLSYTHIDSYFFKLPTLFFPPTPGTFLFPDSQMGCEQFHFQTDAFTHKAKIL